MTPKEYLSRYRQAKAEIECKRLEIKQLEALAQYVSPQSQSGGGKGADKVGRLAAKIADKQRELETQIEELMELRKEIEKLISAVKNPKYRLLLTFRYINCLTYEQIAEKMGISEKWVRILHNKALEKIKIVP